MKKFAVIGATGYVGQAVVKELLNQLMGRIMGMEIIFSKYLRKC